MIFKDMNARDTQIAEMSGGLGPAKGKDFDTGNVLGPWITTADAVGDIRYLGVRALVNGQIIAETTAAGMQHDVVQVLTHISAGETLYPGEVIARSEEHTSELPSLMRLSYPVFCLIKKKHT